MKDKLPPGTPRPYRRLLNPECPKCHNRETEELSRTPGSVLWGCNTCGQTFRVKEANDPAAV